ncbi:MAG: phytoene/squalene synthase family protein [Polyangiales bacterium]
MSEQRTEQERAAEHWQVLAFHARSFRWAAAFLRPAHRERVAALYAFCRAVDDLADSDWVSDDSRRDLDRICAALDAEPKGQALWPEHYLWFRRLCIECEIDFAVVRELLSGMMGDLSTVRFESDRELLRYCYQAAGTVGLMMCSVFGVRDPRAQRHAIDLGIAMQLTNICRDVLEDAGASRVYLPAERLEPYGVQSEQLVSGPVDPEAVSLVVSDLLRLSEQYYRSGDAGMIFLPRRTRWAVLIASRLYRGIGIRLRVKQACNPLRGRAIVPWFGKIRWVAVATVNWVLYSLWPPRRNRTSQLHEHLDGLPYTDAPRRRSNPESVTSSAGSGVAPDVSPVSHAVGHTH